MKKVFYFCIAMVFCLGIFSGCTNYEWQERERITELTGIEIPSNTKVVYHYFDNSFVNGRHAQLTVYEFCEEPTEWLKENEFLDIKNVGKEEEFFDTEWYATTSGAGTIPEEFIPNFENHYYWLEKQRVYFLYFTDSLRLIICVPGT